MAVWQISRRQLSGIQLYSKFTERGLARNRCSGNTFENYYRNGVPRSSSRYLSTQLPTNDFAFAFDIDGVLMRGSKPLEGGKKALALLNEKKIPWILLTNGGGKSEQERVKDLSSKLEIDISTEQFIQSHTPFKRLADSYSKVLVVGGDDDKCRHVAYDYGFQQVVMSMDIIKSDPTIWPFHRFTSRQLNELAQPLTPENFDAVLVFNDSRDWGCDAQVIIDLLVSEHGKLGTRNSTLEQSLPIFWSNNDLLWANDYHLSRFGQGAFRASVEKVFKDFTGNDMSSTVIGKPFLFTYEYAHEVLNKFNSDIYGNANSLKRVYMIGDNPASDIHGGNSFGWYSILLRSGVYKDGDTIPSYAKPRVIVDTVYDAVLHALDVESSV
ncbi:HAD-like domain-containing protein [Dipodascopsis uninucleata]